MMTSKPLAIFHNRLSYEIDFRRCFRLEDDFSFYSRQKQLWHVDSVDLEEQKLTLTQHHDGKAIGKPQTFDLQKHACMARRRICRLGYQQGAARSLNTTSATRSTDWGVTDI